MTRIPLLTREQLQAGPRYVCAPDPNDPQWLLITMRVPNVGQQQPVSLEGRAASARMRALCAASLCGTGLVPEAIVHKLFAALSPSIGIEQRLAALLDIVQERAAEAGWGPERVLSALRQRLQTEGS